MQDNNNTLTFEQMPSAICELMAKVNAIYDYITAQKDSVATQDNGSGSNMGRPMFMKEACEFLGKSASTLYEKTSKRLMPFHKKDNKLYFYKDELIAWIEGRWNPELTPITAQGDDNAFESHLAAMRSGKKRKADRVTV